MKLKDGITFEQAKTIIANAKIKLGSYYTLEFDNNTDKAGENDVTPWAVFKMFFYARSGLGVKRQENIREIFNTIFSINFSNFDTAMEKTGVYKEIKNSRNSQYYKQRLKGLSMRTGYSDLKLSQDTLNKILDFLEIKKDNTDITKFTSNKVCTHPAPDSEPDPIDELKAKETDSIDRKLDSLGCSQAEKDAVIKIRVGQGWFREEVIKLRGCKCMLTGITKKELLIASHILAWRFCKNVKEKKDPSNGFLFAPHVDKLFDQYLITFEDNGALVASDEIKDILKKWGVTKTSLEIAKPLSEETKYYLDFHRKEYKKRIGDNTKATQHRGT